MLERFEHLVGADGEDGRAAPAGDVAEGMREKGFADADETDDRDMGVGVEEAQRGELVTDGRPDAACTPRKPMARRALPGSVCRRGIVAGTRLAGVPGSFRSCEVVFRYRDTKLQSK